MTDSIFGTDGVRGAANIYPMDPETIMRLGMAAGSVFTKGEHKHRVVIGKDTRLSGYMVEPALTAGFISVGMDVVLVGPMPSPAISMLTRAMRADLGVMISASHNPYQDNGIKFFAPSGSKLSDEVQQTIEKLAKNDMTKLRTSPETLGRAKRLDDAAGRYIEHVKTTFPKQLRLDGLKIVVDCANGAAYKLAPTILFELGAEVVAISIEPNGCNINDKCGATYPELIAKRVVEEKADIGIALDGDADRLIICDEKGTIIDGDQIIAAIATHWHDTGELKNNTVVTTVMSNLGLERYLSELGITLERTQVGDRYVVERMKKTGAKLGGEPSGHIVFDDFTTTGDGLVAALQVLGFIVSKQEKASKLLNIFKPLPQILENVSYKKGKQDILKHPDVTKAIKASEQELGNNGRLLIRKSGTEPLIRVMVEATDPSLAKTTANVVVKALKKAS